MKITIKATGLALTPAIQEYVEKRIEGLDKFMHVDSTNLLVQVEVGVTTRHHKTGDIFRAEVKLLIDGKDLYAEAQKEDLYAAVDEMHDKIERELVSLKNKKKVLAKKGDVALKKIIHRAK
jgi:putative sigma-54 modulation protein